MVETQETKGTNAAVLFRNTMSFSSRSVWAVSCGAGWGNDCTPCLCIGAYIWLCANLEMPTLYLESVHWYEIYNRRYWITLLLSVLL